MVEVVGMMVVGEESGGGETRKWTRFAISDKRLEL